MTTPDDFHVAAIMVVRNEADVLDWTIRHAIAQGVCIHVFDNYSDDGSYEIAQRYLRRGVADVQRWAVEHWEHPGDFSWERFVTFTWEYARSLPVDWVMLWSADEWFASNRRGETYRDAVYRLHQQGYNLIDHHHHQMMPVDNGFAAGMDPLAYFAHYINKQRGQIRTARNVDGLRIRTHNSTLPNPALAPEKLLYKHFRWRTQAQAERKQRECMQRRSQYENVSQYYTQQQQYVANASRLNVWHERDWIRGE